MRWLFKHQLCVRIIVILKYCLRQLFLSFDPKLQLLWGVGNYPRDESRDGVYSKLKNKHEGESSG